MKEQVFLFGRVSQSLVTKEKLVEMQNRFGKYQRL
jgi:hypothetical protein